VTEMFRYTLNNSAERTFIFRSNATDRCCSLLAVAPGFSHRMLGSGEQDNRETWRAKWT
jgi:hypothetical protein